MFKKHFRDRYSKAFSDNVKFYLENYDYQSDDFKKHLIEKKQKSENIHEEFVKEYKPEWLRRTDYFERSEDAHICEVHYVDILSNSGFSELIGAVYRLPSKKYKVRCNYKRPSNIKKYDYVHYEYNGYSLSSVADIDFIDNEFIKCIHISKTQLNSFYEMVEYEFHFRKCLRGELYDRFICNEIMEVDSKKDYIITFNTEFYGEENKYSLLEDMNESYFLLICQHYITSVLTRSQLIKVAPRLKERGIAI